MRNRNAQAETGLVILFWGIFLLIIIIVGTTLTILLREHMEREAMQPDGSVDWESGFAVHGLAESHLGGQRFAEYLVGTPDKDAARAHIASFLERARLESGDWLIVAFVVKDGAVWLCEADMRDKNVLAETFLGDGSCNETEKLWKDDASLAHNIDTLRRRVESGRRTVGVLPVPSDDGTALVLTIKKITT